MKENHILIFARYPVAGEAKTRLIPALGAEGAARLHRRMTEHVVAAARALCDAGGEVCVTLCYTGASRRAFRAWLGTDLRYVRQPSGDLGVRLTAAFRGAFRAGAERVLAIGTDVPQLSSSMLRDAFSHLEKSEVVLGPATDGGYVLIGMRALQDALFAPMEWGTDSVCRETRMRVERLGLSLTALAKLPDVDRPGDLDMLRGDSRYVDVFEEKPSLSVIIPTLNEADFLSRTLATVGKAKGVEVIVADGGSHDETRSVAERAGAVFLHVDGGRAAQQNAAAVIARGRHLLFLHADTLVPDGYAESIREALERVSVVAGAFRFRIDGDGIGFRVVEWGTNLRSRWLQCPYGDQGLFMERRVFRELGGFMIEPIMEDYDLVRRIRRRGRVVTLDAHACTSARRWAKLGVLRTTCCNQVMLLGYRVGFSPKRLAQFYR